MPDATRQRSRRDARRGGAAVRRHGTARDHDGGHRAGGPAVPPRPLLVSEGERLRRYLSRAYEEREGVLAGIEDAFLAGLRFLVEHPVLARGRQEEPALLLERVTAHRGPLVDTALDWFAEVIADGVETGEIRDVRPRWAAEVLVRLMLSWFAFPEMAIPVRDEAQAREFARVLLTEGLAAR